jgi:hypothetical protein
MLSYIASVEPGLKGRAAVPSDKIGGVVGGMYTGLKGLKVDPDTGFSGSSGKLGFSFLNLTTLGESATLLRYSKYEA